ncbi:MAG: PrsW family intramembrane metalloprotease [Bacteroidales bacterium]|nr:PrsW family intramembrane metalloprotease [Bacteroidales bacterium]MCF8404038.1 PrsW family intramembrane metalloprotease [Bacteroidales bacterium]
MNLIALASAPVIIILVYVYIRDKYEREPLGLLFKALLAGALTVIPVLLVNSQIEPFKDNFTGLFQTAYVAFIVAAVVEEAFKFLALYLIIWRNKEFNEKFDGIVYAVFISLGFALVENIFYVNKFGETTGYMRALTAVPAHALFGVAMGYYFALAKFSKGRNGYYLLMALAMPVLLHGVYDFLLMAHMNIFLLIFVPFIFYLWKAGYKKMKILSDNSRFKKDIS